MRTKIIDVKIKKVLIEFGPQVYELIGEDIPAPTGFASFAVLNFGDFQNEKQFFHNIGQDGMVLVAIHKCPKYKNQHSDAYYVWENRKNVIKSCSNCNYHFQAVALPNEVETKTEQITERNHNGCQSTNEDPIVTLKKRLAIGEISIDEYHNLRRIIETE